MSLSWGSRLQILLGPRHVALGRLAGRGDAVRASHVEPCAAAGGWRPAAEALEAGLRAFDCRGVRATVILSNAFLRYQVVPWHGGIVRRAERDAFVRLCFQRVFGDAAGGWELRVSGDRYGAAAVASALDRDLLAAVGEVARRQDVRIDAVQPYLMWAFNRWRAAMNERDLCLALVENGHVCLALAVGGQWRSVRNVPIAGSDPQAAVAELVERELCLAALDPAETGIYVRASGEDAFELRRDTLPRAVTLGGPGQGPGTRASDALFALAANAK